MNKREYQIPEIEKEVEEFKDLSDDFYEGGYYNRNSMISLDRQRKGSDSSAPTTPVPTSNTNQESPAKIQKSLTALVGMGIKN
jgi:hypothetical protein